MPLISSCPTGSTWAPAPAASTAVVAVGTAIVIPGRKPLKAGEGAEWQASLWGEDAEDTELAGKTPLP